MIRITFLFIFVSFYTFAQEAVKSRGKAQVKMEDKYSLDETKDIARQLAIINAIEEAFGSYVEQDSDVDIDNGKSQFKIIGTTRVRGEWLKTTHENFKEESRRVKKRKKRSKEEIWITCEVEGLVREINHPDVAFEYQPLNCLKSFCRTYDFRQGEPFYLSFQTPVNGFLSVYMLQEDKKAYRIFPYQEMPNIYKDAVPVETGKDYLLFAIDNETNDFEGFSDLLVDELFMHTDKEKEFVYLYIIFSTHEYVKPLLDLTAYNQDNPEFQIPGSLNESEFLGWLQENRIYDPDFQYKRTTLTISK